MLISVIIPVFNDAKYLSRAIQSVIATSYPHLEMLIIDDGSTDRSLDVANKLALEFPDQVKVLSHPDHQNRGVSVSRNLGIKKASGELVCFLDADDYYHPHRFEQALDILQANPSVDAVYGTTEIIYAEGKPRDMGDSDHLFGLSKPLTGTALLEYMASTSKTWPTTAITLRKKVLQKTGLFPEGIRIAEDCHLWFRMALASNIVPGDLHRPISVYRRHAGNTYFPGLERKADMVLVMADVWKWTGRTELDEEAKAAYRKAAKEFLLRSIIFCRDQGDHRLAFKLCMIPIKARSFGYLLSSSIFRQLISMSKQVPIFGWDDKPSRKGDSALSGGAEKWSQ